MERSPISETNAPVQEAQTGLARELVHDSFITESSFRAPKGEIAEIIAEANKVKIQRLAALVEASTSYTITGLATAGKQGTTFFVRNPSGEQFALKVLNNPPLESQFCAKEDLISYIREASLTAQLDHPFIPKVVEVLRIEGSDDRQEIAVVGRLIKGNSLKELIADRSFKTEEQVRSLLQDMGEILCYLHSQRDNKTNKTIIHSDIKPSNIILDLEGQPHLIDFGVARMIDSDFTYDHTLAPRGSHGYIPKEQQLGAGIPASDIYSLGVAAIECLVGRIDERLLTNSISEIPYQLPQDLEVSPALRKILNKMVHPVANKRYQSATQLLADLKTPPKEKNQFAEVVSMVKSWLSAWKERVVVPSPLIPRIERECQASEQKIKIACDEWKSLLHQVDPAKQEICLSRLSLIEPNLPKDRLSDSYIREYFHILAENDPTSSAHKTASSVLFDELRKMLGETNASGYLANNGFERSKILIDHNASFDIFRYASVSYVGERPALHPGAPADIDKFDELLNIIVQLDTRVFGSDYVNKYLAETLTPLRINDYVYDWEDGGKYEHRIYVHHAKARTLLAGRILELLRSDAVEPGMLDVPVASGIASLFKETGLLLETDVLLKFNLAARETLEKAIVKAFLQNESIVEWGWRKLGEIF